jgi:hypothetical protein
MPLALRLNAAEGWSSVAETSPFRVLAAKGFERPDRTITWHSWQDQPEFGIRTGDRYLGRSWWGITWALKSAARSRKKSKFR